jgi:hypothetical protein
MLGDSQGGQLATRLEAHSSLLSSNLLEAETRAAFHREGVNFDADTLVGIEWVLPDRPLTQEFEIVLAAGYLRGADLWHLAAALYVAQDPTQIAFITLDVRQQAIAEALGFQTSTSGLAQPLHEGQVRPLADRR